MTTTWPRLLLSAALPGRPTRRGTPRMRPHSSAAADSLADPAEREACHLRLRRWRHCTRAIVDLKAAVDKLWVKVEASTFRAPKAAFMLRHMPDRVVRFMHSALLPAKTGAMADAPLTNLAQRAKKEYKEKPARCDHQGLRRYGNRPDQRFRICDDCGARWRLRYPPPRSGVEEWEAVTPRGAESLPQRANAALASSRASASPSQRSPATTVASEELCPLCSSAMVVRVSRANGGMFRGCPRWPQCKGRRPLASIPLGPGLSISMETFMELQHPKPEEVRRKEVWRDPTGWPTPPAAQTAVVNAMAERALHVAATGQAATAASGTEFYQMEDAGLRTETTFETASEQAQYAIDSPPISDSER